MAFPPPSKLGIYPGSFHPLTVAHAAIVDAAIDQLDLQRLDLVVSRAAFDKPHLDRHLDARVDALERFAATRGNVGVAVSEHRLIADLARGYDAVVMGADKWHQLHELRFYESDPTRRDLALAALPQVAVAPRAGWSTPDEHLLVLPAEFAEVSASAVRAGRHDWRAG
ncbi:MAG: hypothetical protein R2754_08660 [Microthrixaceae bacterium]